jgi:hypothetical protein
MTAEKKTKEFEKKMTIHEAMIEFKISHNLWKILDKRYTGQEHTLAEWKKLLK